MPTLQIKCGTVTSSIIILFSFCPVSVSSSILHSFLSENIFYSPDLNLAVRSEKYLYIHPKEIIIHLVVHFRNMECS